MKYRSFYCTQCGLTSTASEWNVATKKYMVDNKLNMKTFKNIQESVGQYQRSYVCPNCGKVVNVRFILGR